jgi:hypothetical protein
MLNKQTYLYSVTEDLALLSKQVELLNTVNLYDINIVAEDFFADLLNLIYDYKLENVNILEKNAAAIDLVDTENKISIQVTSDNTSTKIKHTLSEYIEKKLYEKYDRIIVLILTKKKNYNTDFKTKGTFLFDRSKDIIDIATLITYIRGLKTEKIKEIYDFLEKELCNKVRDTKKTQANEIDTIIDLIEFISKHKGVKKKIDIQVDPQYKIYNRFKNFTDTLVSQYTSLYVIYGNAIEIIAENIGMDEAEEIITTIYLQDISMKFLEENNDNPVKTLDELVIFFEDKLSGNRKKYDRAAIKFYLVNEMIKCNIFPNERNEYNSNK